LVSREAWFGRFGGRPGLSLGARRLGHGGWFPAFLTGSTPRRGWRFNAGVRLAVAFRPLLVHPHLSGQLRANTTIPPYLVIFWVKEPRELMLSLPTVQPLSSVTRAAGLKGGLAANPPDSGSEIGLRGR